MLSKILNKEDCAKCRFCCSFRRKSLWETPLFTKENIEAIKGNENLDDSCLLVNDSPKGIYARYDLSNCYKTDDSKEEVPCPYLGENGCVLSDNEKPWDCKIWPLRVMRKSRELVVALTPTCPEINKLEFEKVREFVEKELKSGLLEYAKEHEFLVKEYKEGFKII